MLGPMSCSVGLQWSYECLPTPGHKSCFMWRSELDWWRRMGLCT